MDDNSVASIYGSLQGIDHAISAWRGHELTDGESGITCENARDTCQAVLEALDALLRTDESDSDDHSSESEVRSVNTPSVILFIRRCTYRLKPRSINVTVCVLTTLDRYWPSSTNLALGPKDFSTLLDQPPHNSLVQI
jgi:hypothetical protein